ncbi:MAG: class C beta-lactamase-related serine hydrolase [Chitinophagaceae bacterium]|nr:MAG: class C beta-lactamase-related serine hydrolase [Chitinophagaceae bacterium]
MRTLPILAGLVLLMVGCKKEDTSTPPTPEESMYFPANQSASWDTIAKSSLNWNQTAVDSLKDFLTRTHGKSFMILINGRIAMEAYFNNHTAGASWEWNSAGKTLVSASIGLAQEEGKLDIANKVSDYLGTGWTSMPSDKENLITVRNLLTMTSGNDDTKQYVSKSNITYVADAGSRWAYSNVFQKLIDVTASATNGTFENYFNARLKNKIGMDGTWNFGTIFTIYHSTTRSMARFGLLALNKGKWNGQQILDSVYFHDCINTSQSINPSYGYLWWLNGKSNFMVPGSQTVFPGYLIPGAPADLYAAMGANDQRIYVIPSKNMVVIRMGDASDPDNPNFAVSGFDQALWTKIKAVIN